VPLILPARLPTLKHPRGIVALLRHLQRRRNPPNCLAHFPVKYLRRLPNRL